MRKKVIEILSNLHLDFSLCIGIFALMGLNFVILYSASGENPDVMQQQIVRSIFAIIIMMVMAYLPPRVYKKWAPFGYVLCTVLLLCVLLFGHVGKGAERWLNLGIVRFQPSELLKIVMPIAIAAFFAKGKLPAKLLSCFVALILIAIPVVLIIMQPDLGTAILISISGCFIIYLAGLNWYLILSGTLIFALYAPIHWFFFMYNYQKQRILTFLNPEADPLNKGYNIIQSKIAIGSGGMWGKGWLNGTQSHLQFLPERHTDFIFAVFCEEFGFVGFLVLLAIYMYIILRCVYISMNAQTNFQRLLSGSLTLTFFCYVFINTGMVSGLLPVVGVPLPLISYGGTSLITLTAAFGIIMSIHTHHKKNNY